MYLKLKEDILFVVHHKAILQRLSHWIKSEIILLLNIRHIKNVSIKTCRI